MAAPSATRQAVRYRLMDVDPTNPLLDDATTLDAAIAAAVSRYSTDRPREVVEDEVGTGSPYFVLVGTGAVLASWLDGVSSIKRIEYPAAAIGASYRPTYLDRQDDWTETYRDGSKTYLYLRGAVPSVAETVRITYTAPHTHTSVTDTVPAGDREALYDLAAYYACIALGTKAAGSSDSTISADSVNYRDSQLRYKQQAELWLGSYNDRMGISDGSGAGGKSGGSGVAGASATGDWDRRDSGNRPFLTHGGRWR